MLRTVVTVPRDLLRATRVDWDIDWRGRGLPETLAGGSGTVYAGRPKFIGQLDLHLNAALVLQWRAVRASARGRANVWRVPMVDPIAQADLFAAVDAAQVKLGLPFSTGQRLSNGRGIGFAVTVHLTVAVAAGDTVLLVDSSDALRPPIVGQILSHDDWPMLVSSVSDTDAAGVQEITVEPPLRAAIPAGAEIEQLATGLFEISEEGAGAVGYARGMRSRPTVPFKEVLDR